MRNVTWIFGTPRGAGGMPVSSKRARLRLSAAISRSPCSTWIGTNGLVVDAGREDLAPLGRDRGVARDELGEHAAAGLDAERERRHVEQQHLVDLRRRARRPGSRRRRRRPRPGSRPCSARARRTPSPPSARRACASCRRRARPVRSPCGVSLASASTALARGRWCARRASRVRISSSLRLQRALEVERPADGPEAMNGRLISVSSDDESSCFAFSAASLRRCSAMRSLRRSMPCSCENSSASWSMMRLIEVLAAEVRVAAGRLDAEDAALRSRGSRCRTCRRRGRRPRCARRSFLSRP